MAAIKRTRWWLRAPLRQKWWSIENWLHGYRFGPIRRHRCCQHTTPSHSPSCVKNGGATPCGYRWDDPFGEINECGKPTGHGGDHLAHWAVDSSSDR